jgi:hypothetical protein
MRTNATVEKKGAHVVAESHTEKTGRDPARNAKLMVRNVADKRPEFAQVEVSVSNVYPGSVRTNAATVLLDCDGAIELAAALLGVGPATLRAWYANVVAKGHEGKPS